MTQRLFRSFLTGAAVLAFAATVQGGPVTRQAPAPAQTTSPEKPKPKMMTAPGIRQPFSEADVLFMSGMIPHHAQAVLMSSWAASHGASANVKLLSERITVSQTDEIKWMQ